VKNQGKKLMNFKLFGQLNAEQRKLFIFAPAAIVITACVLYFGLASNTPMSAQETPNDIDLVLPDAKTKELSNQKQEVFEDLEDHKESLRLDQQNDFDVVLDDPLGTEPANQQKQQQLMTVEEQIKIIEKKQEPIYQGNGTYSNNPNNERPLTKQEKDAKYREDLLKAREARLARSQDYSVPQENVSSGTNQGTNVLEFRVSVHRDQFILPSDRVTLILDNPISYKGNTFPKNTFIYATANIQGSRVLLNVTNIDHVPISLEAKDENDGNLGLHSDRAGELWREFYSNSQANGVNEIENEINQNVNVPLLGPTLRAFGQFFRKRNYKERDKILLVDDAGLILTTENAF